MDAAGVMAVVVIGAMARATADLQTNDRFLTAHNNARRSVSIPALKWSGDLQKYVDDYVSKVRCSASYSRCPYGVSLYLTDNPVGFKEVVKEWLTRSGSTAPPTPVLNFSCAATSPLCSNTLCKPGNLACAFYGAKQGALEGGMRIVWKKTQYVRCTYKLCGNGGRFVARFCNTRGNVHGQRPCKF